MELGPKWLERNNTSIKDKIRNEKGLLERFNSDIGVKQGCLLSPTLFGLHIDKLDKWINKKGRGREIGRAHV